MDTVEGIGDSDGDSVIKSLYLDSDGDGVPHIVEAQISLNYRAPNVDKDYANDDWDADGIPHYLDPDFPTDLELEVDNVITPNDDGMHDVLTIQSIGNYLNNTLRIFNRWGILIFEISAYHI